MLTPPNQRRQSSAPTSEAHRKLDGQNMTHIQTAAVIIIGLGLAGLGMSTRFESKALILLNKKNQDELRTQQKRIISLNEWLHEEVKLT